MKNVIIVWRLSIKTLAVLLMFSFCKVSVAQFVTIPDANFATYLQTNFPSAMSGNQMDTTSASILSVTSVDVTGLGISDLTGIQYFDNLIMLECLSNNLSTLPPLPAGMIDLSIANNLFTVLPNLPAGLISLECSGNSISQIINLPPALQSLVASFNQLTLINSFPSTLSNLTLMSNPNLTSLPALPSVLGWLDVSQCSILTLPSLPASLMYLTCNNNNISCLPLLPNGLQQLIANNNPVNCLPNIPTNGSFTSDIGTTVCNNLALSSITNVLCFGDCSGAATATTLAGTLYDYNWSNGFADLNNSTGTSTVTGLCPGNYTVNVQPSAGGGCMSYASFVITQPSQLNVTISTTTNVSCNGGNDGLLCAAATGGTGSYTYLWSNGAITSCIINLTAGTYTVTVTDANNCTGTVTVTVTEPPQLIVSSGPDQTVCDNTTFILCPLVAGGNPPYNYMLYQNGTPLPLFVPCSTPLTGSGVYALVVTDLNGCVASDTFSLTVNPSPTIGLQTNVNSCLSPVQLCVPPVSNGTPPFSYQWSQGSTTQCINAFVTGPYTYTVIDINGCTVTGATIYTNSPGWVSLDITNITLPTCGMCDGMATVNVSGGNPVATYLWMPGGITTPTNNFICDSVVSWVFVTDTTGCVDSLIVPMSCHSVWPGDANYDGAANNVDLLSIGIGYGTYGMARPNATINWQAESGLDWSNSLVSGINYKHVDCNGDGLIADDDTIAILQNYGLTHPLRLASTANNPNDPYLYFDIIVDTAGTSQHVDVPLYFGTAAVPADSIYGLAFTVNYDTSLVKADSVEITFSPSWIGTVGTDMITLAYNDALNGQLHVGMTRINHTDTSGYGEIARIGIVTTDNVSGRLMSTSVFDTLTFSISDVTIINKDEIFRGYNLGADSLIVQDTTTSLAPALSEKEEVVVYPNPADEFLICSIKAGGLEETEYVISDVYGKAMVSKKITSSTKNIKLKTSILGNGIYFITIKTSSGNIVKKITVLH